jgi:hypothetical protein
MEILRYNRIYAFAVVACRPKEVVGDLLSRERVLVAKVPHVSGEVVGLETFSQTLTQELVPATHCHVDCGQ